jgi:hypothetical protein
MDKLSRIVHENTKEGQKVAIWNRFHNEASFHFWGSYRYASGEYGEAIGRKYPKYAWIHLREGFDNASLDRKTDKLTTDEDPAILRNIETLLRTVNNEVMSGGSRYSPIDNNKLFSGANSDSIRFSLLSRKGLRQEYGKNFLNKMRSIMNKKWGDVSVSKLTIGTEKWFLFERKHIQE